MEGARERDGEIEREGGVKQGWFPQGEFW